MRMKPADQPIPLEDSLLNMRVLDAVRRAGAQDVEGDPLALTIGKRQPEPGEIVDKPPLGLLDAAPQ